MDTIKHSGYKVSEECMSKSKVLANNSQSEKKTVLIQSNDMFSVYLPGLVNMVKVSALRICKRKIKMKQRLYVEKVVSNINGF